MHPIMNSKGLTHVHRSPSICGEEPLGDGLPAALHLQHTLRFCNNAEQALAMQLSYPDCQKCSGIWLDASDRQDPHIDDLGSGLFGIMRPQDSGSGDTCDICVGSPSRHAMPLSAGIQYFPINPLHVFVRVTLAESAEAVCSAARTESRYRMYDAYKALSRLTYASAAYVPMRERFEKAIDARQQGEWWLERAQEATGREQIRLYARATRGFIRAQGWASYVYESLVPQPESPSDLGLDEWFGSWGEWESISSIKPE